MATYTRNDFIKVGERYLLKNSNAYYISKDDMEKTIENADYLKGLLDITSNECQKSKIRVNNDKTNDIDVVKKTTTIKK